MWLSQSAVFLEAASAQSPGFHSSGPRRAMREDGRIRHIAPHAHWQIQLFWQSTRSCLHPVITRGLIKASDLPIWESLLFLRCDTARLHGAITGFKIPAQMSGPFYGSPAFIFLSHLGVCNCFWLFFVSELIITLLFEGFPRLGGVMNSWPLFSWSGPCCDGDIII